MELVEPFCSDSLNNLLQEDIMLIEFRQSYPISCQQSNYDPGAAIYALPELSFETGVSFGRASDMWILGCTIYETRAGFPLFEPFSASEADIRDQMIETLGILPDRWLAVIEQPSFDKDGVFSTDRFVSTGQDYIT